MERRGVFLGIICCLIAGAWTQEPPTDEFVTVGEDITVKPTEQGAAAKDRVDVTLTCTGSKTELSYYIHNRVEWIKIQRDGTEVALTRDSFYKTEATKSIKRFNITNAPGDNGMMFSWSIKGVVDADNGVYKCALYDKSGKVIHEKSLKLTVARGVEDVSMELFNDQGKSLKKKTAISLSGQPLELNPGTYKLTCMATGSNPAAALTFMMDENQPYTNPKTSKKVEAGREKYTTSFEQDLIIKASDKDQRLFCSANTPGSLYQAKSATIVMRVRVHTPEFKCDNVSAIVEDKYTKIHCNISMPDGGPPECNKITWVMGDDGFHVSHQERKKDLDGQFDIVESTCALDGDHLHTMLTLYNTKRVFFDTILYLTYGIGNDAHRHSIHITEKVGAAASLSQVSLLAAIVMAALSHFFVKHL